MTAISPDPITYLQTHRDLIYQMVVELTCVMFWLGSIFSSFFLIVESYILRETQNSKTNTTIVLQLLAWKRIYKVIVYLS